nr:hypothetical protein [Tanacetum cinerariifolium]
MAWQTDYCIIKEGMSTLRGRNSIPGMNSIEREMERGFGRIGNGRSFSNKSTASCNGFKFTLRVGNALLMQAKEKGAVLDAKAEAILADVECTVPYDQPLALTTTNLFEANNEDAYESNVDEGPHASAAFMANLSSIGGTNVQNDSGVEAVPTVVSADEADKKSMIAVLQRMHTEIAGYVWVNDEHKLVNATLTVELEQ